MTQSDFTSTFLVSQSPGEVYNAINHIQGWWSEVFKGISNKVDEEFEVWFADIHYSKQKLSELVQDKKISWLVTDSYLSFLTNKTEWTGTTISFDIKQEKDKTRIEFKHIGLVPDIECFNDCSKGWNFFLQDSLIPYITTGKGKANVTQPSKA